MNSTLLKKCRPFFSLSIGIIGFGVLGKNAIQETHYQRTRKNNPCCHELNKTKLMEYFEINQLLINS